MPTVSSSAIVPLHHGDNTFMTATKHTDDNDPPTTKQTSYDYSCGSDANGMRDSIIAVVIGCDIVRPWKSHMPGAPPL